SEPVKELQSAALLLDFWLGQGVRAAAIPAACCRCFASPCGLPSAGYLPSVGRPARATQAKPKRHATLWARARSRASTATAGRMLERRVVLVSRGRPRYSLKSGGWITM